LPVGASQFHPTCAFNPAARIAATAQAFGQSDDITVAIVEFSGTTRPLAVAQA
jgi:hypothetical protein